MSTHRVLVYHVRSFRSFMNVRQRKSSCTDYAMVARSVCLLDFLSTKFRRTSSLVAHRSYPALTNLPHCLIYTPSPLLPLRRPSNRSAIIASNSKMVEMEVEHDEGADGKSASFCTISFGIVKGGGYSPSKEGGHWFGRSKPVAGGPPCHATHIQKRPCLVKFITKWRLGTTPSLIWC